MSLLEREGALAALDRAIGQAASGEGGVVIVSGDAGVGKTSLVRACFDSLPDDVEYWYGACDDLLTPRPLGPFVDMQRLSTTALPFDPQSGDDIVDGTLRAMHDRRIVMAIDDAQWADDATLDVIASLGRRIAELHGVLVLSVRSDDLPDDHPLHRVLARLGGSQTVRLALQPLSIDAVRSMIESANSSVEPAAVMAATGGNPFYATALLHWSGDGIPPSIRDVVLARRLSLPDRARRVIDLLAVVPGEVEQTLLDALAIESDDIEHAERARLIAATDRGIAFRHQLTRVALLGSLTESRRRQLHKRVLDAWESLDDQPARLVHHAVGAADDRRTVLYGIRALDDAVRAGAHRETVAHARTLLDRSALLDPSTTFQVQLEAARASIASSRFVDAATFADDAERSASTDLDRGRALTERARAELMLGSARPARITAERAVATLEPLGDTVESMRVAALLAQQCAASDDFANGAQWGERALELAGRFGDDEARALIRNYLGLCRLGLGDQSGLVMIETALSDAETGRYESAWRIASNLGVVLMRWGRLADAEPILDRSRVLAAESGSDFARLHTGTQAAVVQFQRGDWAEAEGRLRTMLSRGADGVTLAPLLGALGRLLARRGDDEARTHVERAWRIATTSGESNRLASAGAALLELAWIDGDDGRVAVLAEQLSAHATAAGHHYLAAEACRYGALVGADVRWAAPSEAPALAAFDAGIGGDWMTAARRWAEAGQPYEQALELTSGDDSTSINEGLALLDGLGATATTARLRRELRVRGQVAILRGPQPATRANRFGLTRRQAEVLDLVREGFTNAQIAERLFVSVRTVDHHVSAVLAALDVSSRAEAAAMADHGGQRRDRHGVSTTETHP